MRVRAVSYLLATVAVSACGATSNPNDAIDPQAEEAMRKKDGGRKCQHTAFEELLQSPCGKGKSDAGKRYDADDDDDDDDDDDKDGGGGKRDR